MIQNVKAACTTVSNDPELAENVANAAKEVPHSIDKLLDALNSTPVQKQFQQVCFLKN